MFTFRNGYLRDRVIGFFGLEAWKETFMHVLEYDYSYLQAPYLGHCDHHPPGWVRGRHRHLHPLHRYSSQPSERHGEWAGELWRLRLVPHAEGFWVLRNYKLHWLGRSGELHRGTDSRFLLQSKYSYYSKVYNNSSINEGGCIIRHLIFNSRKFLKWAVDWTPTPLPRTLEDVWWSSRNISSPSSASWEGSLSASSSSK